MELCASVVFFPPRSSFPLINLLFSVYGNINHRKPKFTWNQPQLWKYGGERVCLEERVKLQGGEDRDPRRFQNPHIL